MKTEEFDEEQYLRANPDVAVMVERGLFRSPLDHWQRSGSLEHAAGRRRSGFYEHDALYDEETYLAHNLDVVRLLRARAMASGYEHWMRHGRLEFARGRRHAPFVAGRQPFRPFRLSLGELGVLLVGAPETAFDASRLLGRYADEDEFTVDASAVARSAPMEIVDACNRTATVRFVMVRLRPFIAESRRPRPVSVFGPGGTPSLVSRDLGMQAFFFSGAADASAFLECALGLAPRDVKARADFVERLTTFVVERLHRPPDSREPFSGLMVETLSRVEGRGFDASGWSAPSDRDLTRVSVWCPDSGECADVTTTMRIERPDVQENLAAGGATTGGGPLGFHAFLPLPRASTKNPARLVFGLTLKNGVSRWFENRDVARLLASSASESSPLGAGG